jgi:hypothetical protein
MDPEFYFQSLNREDHFQNQGRVGKQVGTKCVSVFTPFNLSPNIIHCEGFCMHGDVLMGSLTDFQFFNQLRYYRFPLNISVLWNSVILQSR